MMNAALAEDIDLYIDDDEDETLMYVQALPWLEYNPRNDQKTHHWFRHQCDLSVNPKFSGMSASQMMVLIRVLELSCRSKGDPVLISLKEIGNRWDLSLAKMKSTLRKFSRIGMLALFRFSDRSRINIDRSLNIVPAHTDSKSMPEPPLPPREPIIEDELQAETIPSAPVIEEALGQVEDSAAANDPLICEVSIPAASMPAASEPPLPSPVAARAAGEEPTPAEGKAPPPPLDAELVERTKQAYETAYKQRYKRLPAATLVGEGQFEFAVRRLGKEAPGAISYYVGMEKGFYLAQHHSLRFFFEDLEQILNFSRSGRPYVDEQFIKRTSRQVPGEIKMLFEGRFRRRRAMAAPLSELEAKLLSPTASAIFSELGERLAEGLIHRRDFDGELRFADWNELVKWERGIESFVVQWLEKKAKNANGSKPRCNGPSSVENDALQ